jgi:D-arabinose 1-dehydrogenase-like Zn-dependent alcohol dehydrogenase
VEPVVEHYTFDRMPEAFDKLEKGHPKYRVSVDV